MKWHSALALLLAALVAGAGLLAVTAFVRGGISAREQPGAIETFVARRLRHLAIPLGAREAVNPIAPDPVGLEKARAHFADDCALCHGNDGRGDVFLGRNLYPKAPDLRAQATQSLSDGELFYIIQNGVRLTGMPAWGGSHTDGSSWRLVNFIRHLPELTPEELAEMKELNPRSQHAHKAHAPSGPPPRP